MASFFSSASPAFFAVVGIAILLAIVLLLILRQSGGRTGDQAAIETGELEARMSTLLQAQSEMSGRIQTMADLIGGRQAELNKSLSERLDGMTHRLNESVVDAKFPLEAFNALKAAETPEATKSAQTQFRNDVLKHLKDIREKYLIPGETHDTAFMFVPSESVFAEIHDGFDDVVQRAYRDRVVIVSPSLLLLSIQVIQAVLRDHRLRERAHEIQDEVRLMMLDVERLDDRVRNLAKHFAMVEKDVEQILTSATKVTKRGNDITSVSVEPPKVEPLPTLPFDEGTAPPAP